MRARAFVATCLLALAGILASIGGPIGNADPVIPHVNGTIRQTNVTGYYSDTSILGNNEFVVAGATARGAAALSLSAAFGSSASNSTTDFLTGMIASANLSAAPAVGEQPQIHDQSCSPAPGQSFCSFRAYVDGAGVGGGPAVGDTLTVTAEPGYTGIVQAAMYKTSSTLEFWVVSCDFSLGMGVGICHPVIGSSPFLAGWLRVEGAGDPGAWRVSLVGVDDPA